MSETFEPTPRTSLKRLAARGSYDREQVYSILDEGFVCHLGFSVDGLPFVIPTGYARLNDRLLIHGSAASRTLKSLETGIDVCVTVTLVDGLVLARSAFHHSLNYRSVMIFGKAMPVLEHERKMEALRAFTEHVVPGRWDHVRRPSDNELKATLVLELPLLEVSAKVRTGPPIDDEEDHALPVWAGVLPLRLTVGEAIADPGLPSGTAVPSHLTNYSRRPRAK